MIDRYQDSTQSSQYYNSSYQTLLEMSCTLHQGTQSITLISSWSLELRVLLKHLLWSGMNETSKLRDQIKLRQHFSSLAYRGTLSAWFLSQCGISKTRICLRTFILLNWASLYDIDQDAIKQSLNHLLTDFKYWIFVADQIRIILMSRFKAISLNLESLNVKILIKYTHK